MVDQGDSVSCVAQAFSAALYCSQVSDGRGVAFGPSWMPDATSLFERAMAESPDKQRGVSFGSVMAHIHEVYGAGLRRAGVELVELPNSVRSIKQALVRGCTVVAGYQVNRAIQDFHFSAERREAHGYLLPPFWSDPVALSGHAVLIVGYDDSVGCFIARNSWGAHWGSDGHFLIRYRDVHNKDGFTDFVAVGPSS